MPINDLGGSVRVEINHQDTAGLPPALTSDDADHRILAVARNLATEGHDVSVVTKDLPLRLKASVVGLDADEYRNELAIDGGWTGFATIEVDHATIDALYDAACRRRAGGEPAAVPHRSVARRRQALGARSGPSRPARPPRPPRPRAVRRPGPLGRAAHGPRPAR